VILVFSSYERLERMEETQTAAEEEEGKKRFALI